MVFALLYLHTEIFLHAEGHVHKTRQKGSLIRSERNKKSAIIIAIISKTHRGKLSMKIINWANISLHFANNWQSANLRVFGLNKLQWDFSLIQIWSEGLKKQLTKYWSFLYLHSSNVNVKIKIHYKQAVLTVLLLRTSTVKASQRTSGSRSREKYSP